MGGEWKEMSLDQVYEFRSGLSKPREEFGRGYQFLTFKDVFYNYFVPDKLTELVNSSERERLESSIRRGDIFLTRTSETFEELGMSCVALRDYPDATFNGFCKRLRPYDNTLIVPEYAGYYFRSPMFRNAVTTMSTMSTRASLNNEILSKLKIIFPPKGEQQRIGQILKSLDDKIALNRKMNATLEAMAQALFQSWFVDFDPVIDKALSAGHEIPEPFAAKARRRAALGDRRKPLPAHIAALFPDRFVETEEMGWVPEGWEVNDIGSVVDRITVPRRYAKDEVFPSGKIPVLEQGSSIYMGYHNNNPDVTASIDAPAVVFGDHTCILELMIEPFSISSNVITFRGKNRATTWVYYAIIGKQASEEYRRHWSEFIIKKVILPSQELAEVFPQQLKVLIGKTTQLRRQANTLTTLRDTLLPKLISGELRLPDAEATLQSILP